MDPLIGSLLIIALLLILGILRVRRRVITEAEAELAFLRALAAAKDRSQRDDATPGERMVRFGDLHRKSK